MVSCCYHVAANVTKALQTFWKKKLLHENTALVPSNNEALICYTVEPVTQPPFACYVTLPNGCCFGNMLSVRVHRFYVFYCKLVK